MIACLCNALFNCRLSGTTFQCTRDKDAKGNTFNTVPIVSLELIITNEDLPHVKYEVKTLFHMEYPALTRLDVLCKPSYIDNFKIDSGMNLKYSIGHASSSTCEHRYLKFSMNHKDLNVKASIRIKVAHSYSFEGCVFGGIQLHSMKYSNNIHGERILNYCDKYLLNNFNETALRFTSDGKYLILRLLSFRSTFQASISLHITGSICKGIYFPDSKIETCEHYCSFLSLIAVFLLSKNP